MSNQGDTIVEPNTSEIEVNKPEVPADGLIGIDIDINTDSIKRSISLLAENIEDQDNKIDSQAKKIRTILKILTTDIPEAEYGDGTFQISRNSNLRIAFE